jgi:ecotin
MDLSDPDTAPSAADTAKQPARIAVIGAAWWSQTRHLPQLLRNPDAEIAAIMEPFEAPRAAAFLKLTLETKTQLRERYKGVPIFSSCEEMLADEEAMGKIDGVIIATAHAFHAVLGMKFLAAGKHVLMEKPMTVDVLEACTLAAAADRALREQKLAFMVNNTANFRAQSFEARRLVEAGEVGDLHHVLAVMYSPLMFLFDDPANDGWVKATGKMLQPDGSGNGFGYGQLSHLLGWVVQVGALEAEEVTAMTHRSERSGADLMDAALIRCKGGVALTISGGCGWPGNEHGKEATGKHFDIKMFGSKGVLMYGGDDKNPASGRLELRKHDGSPPYVSEGFLMENTGDNSDGPESLLEFIKACRGLPYQNGADQNVGLQVVRMLDAMYRSAASKRTEAAGPSTSASVVAPPRRPDDGSQWQKAYPAAAEGMKRVVIHLDAQADEYSWKIELTVGKEMETDGVNHRFGGAKIDEKTVEGWGYGYFEATTHGGVATTRIGIRPGQPKVTRFVTMASTGPVRYNSRLPVVVYLPVDLEVQYRLWKAEPESRQAETG